jgi:hypothetical protein
MGTAVDDLGQSLWERSRREADLELEQQMGPDLGELDRVRYIRVVEVAGRIAVKAETPT